MAQRRSLCAQLVDLHYVGRQHREQILHQHSDRLELLYVFQGEGQYFVGDRSYAVRRGSLVVCNAGTQHGERADWNNQLDTCCCVYQNVNLPNRPSNTITKPSDPLVLFFAAEQTMLEYMIFSLYEQYRKTGVENDVCHMLGNAVLNLVLDRLSNEKDLNREDSALQNEALVKEIITYIDEHLHEPMNLNQVAEHFYISTSHLSHAVKKAAGISPIRYMLVRRIGEAQNLLMNTSMSISELSKCLGFEDSTYFSRSFKKLVGITPTEYRKNFLKR